MAKAPTKAKAAPKAATPKTTRVAPERDETVTEPVTKLAEAPVGKPTAAQIDEIAGKGRDPAVPEESANADVAKTLAENAKASADDEPRPYFHGQGGAFGV